MEYRIILSCYSKYNPGVDLNEPVANMEMDDLVQRKIKSLMLRMAWST